MLLSYSELVDLTGYKRGKEQASWLESHGWIFEIDRLGRPKVSIDYFNTKMGGKIETNKRFELKFA